MRLNVYSSKIGPPFWTILVQPEILRAVPHVFDCNFCVCFPLPIQFHVQTVYNSLPCARQSLVNLHIRARIGSIDNSSSNVDAIM